HDKRADHVRHASPMVLPGEKLVPVAPIRIVAGGPGLAGQAEIADRHHMKPAIADAVPVGEGIKLLDISQRMMRLLLDPGPQPGLQRSMRYLERTGGQGARALD